MVESGVAARWSGMGSAVVRGFGRARAGACQAAARAASSRAVAGPKPGPGRRGGRLDILAALLLGAALATPAWAQDIVHPRVLMDTQITVGGYRTTVGDAHAGLVDHWGYAAGPAIDADNVVETVHDGSLGDTAFVYRGVEYTVKRLTMVSGGGSFKIEIEDADAAALPDTAAVGIELQGTGGTVLFDWRLRARPDVDREVRTLPDAWRNAPGTVLPVRILNLDASDVWSADLDYGTLTSLTVGYGAPATGTLTATGFFLNGVEYTVDRLTVTTNTSAVAVVRFATTPDLPATGQLRLAVPRTLPDFGLDPALDPGLNRYLALEPASRVSGGTDVDYEWPWPGVNGPETLADRTNTFYLTRAPGRTGDVSGFWEATLTPNTHTSTLVGYRRPAVTIADFTHEATGAGTLTPGTMSLRGVEYTVDALAVVSVSGSGWNVGLRTDPLLPRGQDLWLELGHVDGSTAVFAIDTASVEAPGYLWRLVYAGDRHGWGTDSADADTDIDSVTVRLSTGAPTITGTAQVGETLTAVTTGITDADGLTRATYTYQWIQVNGTAADIAAANSSTYTLVDADLGKAIKVKVSFTDDDDNAETRTSAATATVTVTNNAPTVANPILDQTATAGTVFIFDVPEDTFTDADSDTLTYTATQSDGSALPAWLRFDAAGPGFSGLPGATDVETVSVKVTASDGNGGSVSDTFDIVVSADTTVNCAGMCLVSNVGQTTADVQGFADSDFAQSFTTGANPGGYTLTSIELKLSGTSSVDTTPTVKLFRVSANGTEVDTLIGPTMLDGLSLKDYAFTPSKTVNLGTAATYWVVAEGVSGVSWSNTAATAEDLTPAAGWGIGDRYESRAASSTGGFTTPSGTTTNLQIRVNGTLGSTTVTNAAPTVANPIDDQTATVGTALDYAFPANTFADTDAGDTLTYTANQSDDSALPAWLSFDAATRTFSGTPAAADLGTVSVKVTASDGTLSVSDTFDIVVSAAANNAPMFATDTTSRSFTETVGGNDAGMPGDVGAVVTATDADGDTLTYSLEGTDAAKFGIVEDTGQIQTKSTQQYDREVKASYSVTVKAVDGNGGSDTIMVTITVDNGVEKPQQPDMPTVTATSGSTTSLDVSWTAPDNEGRPAITGYKVQYRAGVSGNWTSHAHTGTGTTATIAGLTAATSYQVQVLAVNADGDGPFSGPGPGTTGTVTATAPMVTDVDVTSTPASGDTYGTGEMILFTVTFDQSVTVTGAPEFEFCLGTTATMSCDAGSTPPARRRAALLSGSGTTALVFGYTVVAGDVDDNGIWTGDQSRSIKLEGGTIQGTVGGLDAVLTHAEEGEHSGHKVNGATANTAPTAAHNTVTTAEDRAYTFTAVDFGFMDADAGAALASVKIVTVPGAGTLALDGTAVMAADVVTEAQIDADMLTFTPAQDAHGAPYTTFTFKVNDGTDDSDDAYTMTIDVTDAPAPVCTAPSFGDRREIWTGTLTVGPFDAFGTCY